MRKMILNLHGIGTPGRPMEDGEAPYWVSEAFYREVVALSIQLHSETEVSFTFDDGNASDLRIGAAVLSEYGVSGLFFMLAGRIDQAGSLSVADLRELQDMGHTVGSHGADHRDWTQLDPRGQQREFYEARQKISDAVGCLVDQVAIPFGRYNRRVLSALHTAGYQRVYSSDKGGWSQRDFPIPRTSLTASMTLDDVHRLLTKTDPLKMRLRRRFSKAIKKRV